MSETAQATPIGKAKQQPNTGYILGKITSKRKIKTAQGPLHLTVLKLPSNSEFEHPSTVELRSEMDLGAIGEEWQGAVTLRGMPNNYDTLNKDTNEKERVISARNEYQVID